MRQEKRRPSAGTLETPSQCPDRGLDLTNKKLLKYARLKNLNCRIGVILGNLGRPDLQEKLESCGRFLAFRHYLFSGEWKLRSGYFCDKHMMCPPCSAARSRRLLARWLPAVFSKRNEAQCRHYLLTLTWPPPPVPRAVAEGPEAEQYKLRANLTLGLCSWNKLWKRRVNRRSGPLRAVKGAILATEITYGAGGWHPHFHILLTMPRNQRVDAVELRREWSALTGGLQVNLCVLKQESDVVEVFKYTVKPVDLGKGGTVDQASVETRLLINDTLAGCRLIRGYGFYHGVKEPDLTESEEIEDLGEWVDLIFQWMGRSYELVKTIPGGIE